MEQEAAKRRFIGLGICFFVAVFAIMAGYYSGDMGFRLFPDVTSILLLLCGLGFFSLFIASSIHVSAEKQKGHGRKRLLSGFFTLFFLGSFAACFLIPKPDSALYRLSTEKFDLYLRQNMEMLDTCEKELNALMERFAERRDIFDGEGSKMLSASQEQFLRQSWRAFYDNAYAIDQIRAFYSDWYQFDLSRQQRKYNIQSFLLASSAETILYEKAIRMLQLVKPYPNVIAFLDSPDPDGEMDRNSFSRMQTDFLGFDRPGRILSIRAYLQWLEKGLKTRCREYSGDCFPLWSTLETRFALIDQIEALEHGREIVDADIESLRRGFNRIWFPAQKGVAEWMGGTRLYRIGQYLITPELQGEMDAMLQPGDVMLSRKNWYLSNVGLPGFWPHAILYLGDPQKMITYFDDPAVQHYVKIQTGEDLTFDAYMAKLYPQKWLCYKAGTGSFPYQTMEAIKYGVVLHPLTEACGDYMAAIRPRLDKVAKAQAIIEAFRHLDKPYDFDFDFSTDHALVCTELVWRSYRPDINKRGLKLEPIELAGRKTLPANKIAALYVREHENHDRQFDFVFFVDALEAEERAFLADENTFLESVSRPKWSFALE